ncbi:alpha/beta hydrolase [Microbulbifer taiwanensis]|uniref:alpha/beta hydrolase n=1 Tax=Microbulbifer taiwanensis TaxID=986746 RepID=UPI0036186C7C
MDASLFIPDGPAPLGGYPTVLLPGGWGQDKSMYDLAADMLSENGYLVLSYSNRGFSNSGGLADVAGPDTLGDISALIDWLESNYAVGKIGLGGISYGGGISLLGAVADDRVDAVAAMSAWADLEFELYPNETVNFFWGNLLLSAERTIPEVDQLWENITERKNLDQVRAFSASRSAIYRIQELNQRDIPILVSHQYGDYLFKPNRILDLFEALETPKKLLLNPGTHGATESLDSALYRHIWHNNLRWFDHYLKGEDNGVDSEPSVDITTRLATERELHNNWPVTDSGDRYFLHPRLTQFHAGALSETPTWVFHATIPSVAAQIPRPAPVSHWSRRCWRDWEFRSLRPSH